ncbi:hypothetical protein BH11CYA1_BH11CYA1_00310 [soil metagenome]
MKLRIIHKGLLLLLVPFASQLVLFGALFALNLKAEQIASEERLRNRFMQVVTVSLEDSGVAWGNILNNLASLHVHNSPFSMTAAEYHEKTEKQLNELRAMPFNDADFFDIVKQLQELRDVQEETFKVVEQNSESFGDLAKIQAMKTRYKNLRDNLHVSRAKLVEINKMGVRQRLRIDQVVANEKLQRDMMKTILICGFVMQLALTAGLIFYFLKNITERLNILVSNAHNLPEGVELQEYVRGSDEIAYLDSVLHDASNSLMEASQNRQAIMNMIAHDIRSPLMAANLLLEKLAGEIASSEAGSRTAVRLQKTFKQLSLLVEDLLAIDKLESGTLELELALFDLKALAEEAAETARPQAEKRNIQILNNAPAGEVVADRGRILQVLNNFISNAVKYSTDGSAVEIRAKFEEDKVSIYVVDKGKGITKKDLPHVFDKFFQSSDPTAKQGFGLGLAISKLIVLSHNGNLGAESVVGQGSTFWLSLPVDE